MKYLTASLAAWILFAASLTSQAAVETYQIDTAHSGVTFKIRHFFSKVPGSFGEFEGVIKRDTENPKNNSAEATIKVGSVDTNNEKRDKHLRNDDYFNEPKYPVMTFKSTKWETTDKENIYKMTGDLTILGKTKSVAVEVTYLGEGVRRGKNVIGWEGKTTIERSEWGMTSGQGALGDEVEIEIMIEAIEVKGK